MLVDAMLKNEPVKKIQQLHIPDWSVSTTAPPPKAQYFTSDSMLSKGELEFSRAAAAGMGRKEGRRAVKHKIMKLHHWVKFHNFLYLENKWSPLRANSVNV